MASVRVTFQAMRIVLLGLVATAFAQLSLATLSVEGLKITTRFQRREVDERAGAGMVYLKAIKAAKIALQNTNPDLSDSQLRIEARNVVEELLSTTDGKTLKPREFITALEENIAKLNDLVTRDDVTSELKGHNKKVAGKEVSEAVVKSDAQRKAEQQRRSQVASIADMHLGNSGREYLKILEHGAESRSLEGKQTLSTLKDKAQTRLDDSNSVMVQELK